MGNTTQKVDEPSNLLSKTKEFGLEHYTENEIIVYKTTVARNCSLGLGGGAAHALFLHVIYCASTTMKRAGPLLATGIEYRRKSM
eukprot:1634461-Amphidinium_carterae.2